MTDMANRLDRVIDEAIAGNRIVGAVVLVMQDGKRPIIAPQVWPTGKPSDQ